MFLNIFFLIVQLFLQLNDDHDLRLWSGAESDIIADFCFGPCVKQDSLSLQYY